MHQNSLCRSITCFYVVAALLTVGVSTGQVDTRKYNDMLNTCITSKTHKYLPGPETDLFKQCSQWKKNACCTSNTTEELHQTSLYNFNLDHCDYMRPLSDKCREHFIQDLCFYECEPNTGPWRVKTKRKFASERFQNIPLCASQCQEWFDACRNDFTCVVNWPKQMNFTGGLGNKCPKGAKCRIFEEVYNNNASLFCNQVWDESFIVVPDNQPCMKIFFDGNKGNPNEQVAIRYVKDMMRSDINNNNGAEFARTNVVVIITLLAIALLKTTV